MEVAGNWTAQQATSPNFWAIQQKYSVCRLCLCHGGLFDIFDSNAEMDIELKETIENLLQCPVEREEGFPWLVCHTCEAKLTEFRLFKRRCLECKQAFDIRFKCYKPVVIAPQNVMPIPLKANLPPEEVEKMKATSREMEDSSQICHIVDQDRNEEEMKAMGEEMEESSQLCRIAEVGQLNINQFESGVISVRQPIKVNRIKIESMTEVPQFEEVEDNTSEATEMDAPLLEPIGNQDMKREPVDWDDAPQLDRIKTEPWAEEENSFGTSEVNAHMTTNMSDNDMYVEPNMAIGPDIVAETDLVASTDMDEAGNMAVTTNLVEATNIDFTTDMVTAANINVTPCMAGVTNVAVASDIVRARNIAVATDLAAATNIPFAIAPDFGQGLDVATIMPVSITDQAGANDAARTWKPSHCSKLSMSERYMKGGTFCCVPNCRNSMYTRGIQYVKIPRDVGLATELLASIGQLDLLPNDLRHLRSQILCMDHFAPSVKCGKTQRLIFGPLPRRVSASETAHHLGSSDQTLYKQGVLIPATPISKHIKTNLKRLNVLKRQSSNSPSASSAATSRKPDYSAPPTITVDDTPRITADTATTSANAATSTVKPRVKAPRKQALNTRLDLSSCAFPEEEEVEEEEEFEYPPPSPPRSKPRFDRKISCFVPMCPNKGLAKTKKYFVSVPKDERRKIWLQVANYTDVHVQGNLFCCEDHFEMKEDFFKYSVFSRMYAGVRCLTPKAFTVPRYFDCQVGRTRVHNPRLRGMRSYKPKMLPKELMFSEDDSSSSSESSSHATSPAPSPVPQPVGEAEKDDKMTEDDKDVKLSNSNTLPSSLPENPDCIDGKEDGSVDANCKIVYEDNDSTQSNSASEFSGGSKSDGSKSSRRKQVFDFSSRTELVCDVDELST